MYSWKHYKKLHLKKYRQERKSFIVEGKRLCLEAMNSHWSIEAAFVSEKFQRDAAFQEIYHRLINKNIPLSIISDKQFTQLSDTDTPQGILLVVHHPAPKSTEIEELMLYNIIILLDGIRDPGNLGAIVRTAHWFGVPAIFSSPDSVDFYNLKSVRASMGSLFQVYCTETEDLFAFINRLKRQHYTIIGTAASGGVEPDSGEITFPLALVMGSEAEGISTPLIPLIDRMITIKKFSNAESLNVAVATGILLDHLVNIPPR